MKPQCIAATLTAALALSVSAWGADDEKKAGEGRKDIAARQRDPEAAFKRLDADSDSKVTKEEFKKSVEQMMAKARERSPRKGGENRGPSQALDRIFDQLDTDKDGALSLDEYKKIGELRGQSGERPGAGKLDPEKLKKLRERRGGAAQADDAKPEPAK
jgi:hypothetical protein